MVANGYYLGFDFGYKRIGVAVGQIVTETARPLSTISAVDGIPLWHMIEKIIREWRPIALVVGLPTCINGKEQYTTKPALAFGEALGQRFSLPVHYVDERFSTMEARSRLFEEGGYRKLASTQIDSIAACLILEQWMQYPE